MKLRSIALVSVVGAAFVSGCASYYRVTEPGATHTYYTDKVDRKDSGVVVFKDAATQMEVTLPASQIEKITKEQFDTGKAQAAANNAMAAPSNAMAAPSNATAAPTSRP
jgi:hypothetical protein